MQLSCTDVPGPRWVAPPRAGLVGHSLSGNALVVAFAAPCHAPPSAGLSRLWPPPAGEHALLRALRDGLRVLIAEGGLLLAGTVTGICPPDIYGVAVDGERGCRPRILSTEELLRQAVRRLIYICLASLCLAKVVLRLFFYCAP